MRTEKPFCGLFEVWLCDLGLDATYDGGLSEAHERGAICGGDGADVDEEVTPLGWIATVWTEVICEKAFEVGFWMESLEYLSVKVHCESERETEWGITKQGLVTSPLLCSARHVRR
jgi:hypothetical protein